MAGAHQVGKTTLIRQVPYDLKHPTHYASADEPTVANSHWIDQQWEAARLLVRDGGRDGAVRGLEQIQKVPPCSEAVRQL